MNAKDKAIHRFKKAAEELRASVLAARSVWPEAELYLAASTLNLMAGPHHSGTYAAPRAHNVITSVRIPEMDGGDW